MSKELFPFRYRDELTGKWVRARYLADQHEIVERYKEWEITGPIQRWEAYSMLDVKFPSSNGWTPERRARQAELIRNWRLWEKSTGPRTTAGKTGSADHAWKHGAFSEAARAAGRLVRASRCLLKELERG